MARKKTKEIKNISTVPLAEKKETPSVEKQDIKIENKVIKPEGFCHAIACKGRVFPFILDNKLFKITNKKSELINFDQVGYMAKSQLLQAIKDGDIELLEIARGTK